MSTMQHKSDNAVALSDQKRTKVWQGGCGGGALVAAAFMCHAKIAHFYPNIVRFLCFSV